MGACTITGSVDGVVGKGMVEEQEKENDEGESGGANEIEGEVYQ
jgi:hypothetical protein